MKPIELPAMPDPDPFSDPISVALVDEAFDWGYPSLEVEDVARRAGVSVEEFHRRFADLDHCALDTYERLIAAFERRVGTAFNREPDWRRGLRAAAFETAAWLEEHPGSVKFGTTEVLQMRNEMARVRREEVFGFCAEMIDRGREVSPEPGAVPEGASMVAIGSILQFLTRRLQEGAEIRFPEAARESLYGVVRTYLGEDAAREELSLPLPPQLSMARR
jgi:AcrR family transcriptional regulator